MTQIAFLLIVHAHCGLAVLSSRTQADPPCHLHLEHCHSSWQRAIRTWQTWTWLLRLLLSIVIAHFIGQHPPLIELGNTHFSQDRAIDVFKSFYVNYRITHIIKNNAKRVSVPFTQFPPMVTSCTIIDQYPNQEIAIGRICRTYSDLTSVTHIHLHVCLWLEISDLFYHTENIFED